MSKNCFFLIGGPGSGKNIVINSLLEHGFQETTLQHVKKNFDVSDRIIISGSASLFEDIKQVNSRLLESGYITGIIFVDVSKDVAITRLRECTEVHVQKIDESKSNINRFYDLFDNFIKIDNDGLKEDFNYSEIDIFINEVLSVSNLQGFVKKAKNKSDEIVNRSGDDRRNRINKKLRSTKFRSNLSAPVTNQSGEQDSNFSQISNPSESISFPDAGSPTMTGGEGNSFSQESPSKPQSYVYKSKKNTWNKAKRILFRG
jgi:dephospho-CoA kinase